MRCLAIGDIHGCHNALTTLDEALRFSANDTVIFLGDYVDRGPDTKGVIDFILDLRSRCNVITLRGNHEIIMLKARHDMSARTAWMELGGRETLDSYDVQDLADIPSEHWNFLESTIRYHEIDRDFFVHAGVDPFVPLAKQPDEALFWLRFIDPQPHQNGKRMICGHTSQKSGLPENRGHAVCIDTFAYGGAWLTCLDVTTNHYWQTNEAHEFRIGNL